MRNFAGNTPISRPANTVSSPDRDFGGICWDKRRGFVFKTTTEDLPFQDPERREHG
jgi:hypothetical protein